MWIWPSIGLLNKTLFEHALDGAVQSARPQANFAVGSSSYVAFDCVAMPFPVSQRQENLKDNWSQREELVNVITLTLGVFTSTLYVILHRAAMASFFWAVP